MNKNISQQNAERRLRHSRWEQSRSFGATAVAGFLAGLLLIAALALTAAGPEFFS